ncbi:uncharacterized mitochondrial protein-like protein [Tanacetum coccineum]
MNEFCAKKGIKREYSIARTPQQNGVAERKNRTLIEAARTMLADSLLPIQFWAEAVNTACYVLNRVLFDGKSEEGYLLGYSTNSKGFRVYNRVTRKVQDCLHVNFLENQENQKGKGPDWMFDLDLLTPSMNYIPVRKENYADSKEQGISCDDVEDLDDQQFIVLSSQAYASEERTVQKTFIVLKNKLYMMSLEKRRISITKGEKTCQQYFHSSTANYTPQSTGNTPTESMMISKKMRNPRKVSQALADEIGLKHSRRTTSFKLQTMDVKSAFYMATSQKKCMSKAQVLTILLIKKGYRVSRHFMACIQAPRAWLEEISGWYRYMLNDIIFGSHKSFYGEAPL